MERKKLSLSPGIDMTDAKTGRLSLSHSHICHHTHTQEELRVKREGMKRYTLYITYRHIYIYLVGTRRKGGVRNFQWVVIAFTVEKVSPELDTRWHRATL